MNVREIRRHIINYGTQQDGRRCPRCAFRLFYHPNYGHACRNHKCQWTEIEERHSSAAREQGRVRERHPVNITITDLNLNPGRIFNALAHRSRYGSRIM